PDAQRTPLNAAIWRYHPRRDHFEVFAQGTSNPWGFDFNDRGQAFLTACVIPHLYHVIQGGRYFRQAGQHFNPYTYDDIPTIAVHRHWIGDGPHLGNEHSNAAGGGHAHAGAMLYLGGAWPDEYRDQIFMNNIHGARINMDRLTQVGSGYVGNRGPDFLLANDSWSQILNLQYGPDGQVFMIDWYDRNQCHHRSSDVHDRSNGRIFKVVYGNPQPVHVDLKKSSNAQLVELQLHANDWYVRHARRILQERGPDADTAARLERMLAEQTTDTRRLRALWCLHVMGAADDELLARTLDDASPWVRGWAIQLLCERPNRQLPSALAGKLAQMAAQDSSPVARLYLASAAGRLPLAARWPIMAGLAAHAEDVDDHNLPLLDWYAAEPLAAADPRRLLELVTAGRIPLLVEYSARRVGSLGTPESIALLVEFLGRADKAHRQLFLSGLDRALAGRRQVPMPANWPQVSEALQKTADTSQQDKLQQDTVLALSATFGDAQAVSRLLEIVADRRAETPRREAALAALLKVRSAQLGPLLLTLLDDQKLRSRALRALAAFGDAQAPEAILRWYPRLSADEKQDALSTLASRVDYARLLLAAVGRKAVPAANLSAELVRQLRNFKDPQLDKQIEQSWGTLRESAADKLALMAKYKALAKNRSLPEPDLSRGRGVFAAHQAREQPAIAQDNELGDVIAADHGAGIDDV
ncbi:MAG TPA: PVC-type heme-binding CxxCH protein, partial [Pirellulales bacterium]|nr:PVC-type heme-binding CxxCH protein [Pirellulales bacterium]